MVSVCLPSDALLQHIPSYYGMRFVTLYRRKGSRPSSRKRNAKKAKRLSEEALQIAVKEEKRKAKEKRKDISI